MKAFCAEKRPFGKSSFSLLHGHFAGLFPENGAKPRKKPKKPKLSHQKKNIPCRILNFLNETS